MKVKLLGRFLEIKEVELLEPKVSKHTSNELERFTFRLVSFGDSDNAALIKEITQLKEGGFYSYNDDESILKEYKIMDMSYSIRNRNSGDDSEYSYTITAQEVESLEIDHLAINDLKAIPYDYSEEYDNGLIINAKIKVKREMSTKLNELKHDVGYFNVVRKGISDKNIKMRFGKVIWSEDGDYVKMDICLVEDAYDTIPSNAGKIMQPELGNIMNILAYTVDFSEKLSEILISKGIISANELEDIKKASKENIKNRHIDYFKVEDIDSF